MKLTAATMTISRVCVHPFERFERTLKSVSDEIRLYWTRGGVTSIYTGTGRAIFWGAFFEQEIHFGVSFLVRV